VDPSLCTKVRSLQADLPDRGCDSVWQESLHGARRVRRERLNVGSLAALLLCGQPAVLKAW
jgi:hypothetical protein